MHDSYKELKLVARTKIKTSIAVLAGVLFLLGVVTLMWVLPDSASQVAVAGRVLYRTNDPSGQMRYVVAVTNLSSRLFLVQLSQASFTNRIWSPTQSVPFVLFDGFDLRSHSTRLIAVVPLHGAVERPSLWYQRCSAWPQWSQRAGEWIRSLLRMPRPDSPAPEKLVINLPEE